MKVKLIILIILLMVMEVISQGHGADRVVYYRIKAVLNSTDKSIEGYEIINWKNTGSNEVKDLCLHLYMNAFKNNKTYFMKESKGVHRRNVLKEGDWGYIEIKSISLADGRTLKGRIKIDDTVMWVNLYEPIAVGKDIYLEVNFRTKLPRIFARTGYFNDFYMVGQWFPKIAVYENDHWNCHYFHANSEFYSDFGNYSVDITVPNNYIVAATGNITGKKKNVDSTISYSYLAEDVHDFSWSASPDFLTYTGRYNDIEIQLYYFRSHKSCVNRYIKSIKSALSYFEQWYGKYPYSKITIIDPPFNAKGAGGMEYPTLITGGSSFYVPEGMHSVELVTVHEFGHQYWYGLVANNEFEEAWLDEGINSYSTAKVMNQIFEPSVSMFDFWGLKLSVLDSEKIRYLARMNYDPIYQKSWLYYDMVSYSVNSYSKPTLFLFTLENFIGTEKMNLILSDYFKRYKFKHPKTRDFLNVIKEHVGNVYNKFIEDIVYGTGVIDYAIDSIKIEEITSEIGFFERNGNLVEITKRDTKKDKKKQYENEVIVRRKGEISIPIDLEFIFEGGKVIRVKWDGKQRWNRYTFTEDKKLKCAIVDRDNKILLDINRINNSMCREENGKFKLKYTSALVYYFQYFIIKLLNFL